MEHTLFYKIVICLLTIVTFSLPVSAQEIITAHGIVTDGNLPLRGISVFSKHHKTKGSITDSKGSFSLKISSKDTLVISGIGYQKQEIPASSETVNIILKEDVTGLNDVVVLGYGQTKKITLTGAVSSITGATIRQSPSASLQNSLAGRLPGLFSEQRSGQPGNDGASIQIRGLSSYTSSSSPLIIVDNIEFTYSQLSQIDPNEIESISILKDASTTAVYGIRGANGVIVVTTRRGKAGKPELTLRHEFGLQTPTKLPKLNSGYTTLRLLKEYTLEQGLDPATQYPLFFSGNSLDYYRDNSDPYGHPYVDWWKTLMRKNSPQDRVNFDISGGSKLIRYFISLGYITQGGIYKNFTKDQGYNGNYFYNRYNFRSNVDMNPTKTLHIAIDLSGRFGVTNSPNDLPWNNGGNTFQYLWNQQLSSFLYPLYNPNGTFGNVLNPQSSGATKPNPMANLTYSGYNRGYDNNFNAVTSAEQKLDFITKGLSLKGLVSYASDFTFNRSLTRSASQILSYYYNAATQVYTPATLNLFRNGPLSRSSTPTGTSQLLNLQAALNYSRGFGYNHVSLLVLANKNSNNNNAYASSVVTPGTPTNYTGYTGRLSYNFKEKYLFDLNTGYNGSDRFGNGKKYGLFPAVSAGWNIAEEPFFKNNISFINFFKIRGSYGMTGSDNIGGFQYLYQQVYNSGQTGYNFGTISTNVGGINEGSLGNPNVTWEKKRATDIGLDMKLFKSSLSLTADYFHDYRYDILTTRGSVPSVFGVGLPPVNLGEVENHGYEIELKYNSRINKITYWIDGQLSYAKNKILFMDEPSKKYPWLASTGHSIGALFGYTWTGKYFQNVADILNSPLPTNGVPLQNVFPGGLKLADLNKDGILDQNDQGYLGTNQPEYTAGLSFGISYKGLDLSVLFNGAFGYIINMQRGLTNYTERAAYSSIPYVLGRWTPDNAANATYPALNGGVTDAVGSSFWYHDGSYIRFKNFELGYTLPSLLVKRLHLKTLRVYANGYNLGLVYNALPVPIDPESVASTSVGEYPQEKIINFGIQLGL